VTTLVLLHRHIQKRSQRQLRSSLRRHTSQRPDQQEQLEGCWQPARASAVRAQQACSRAQDGPFGARRPRIAYSYRMPSAVATSTATCAAWRIDGLGIGLRQPGSILGTRTSCRLLRPRAQLPSVEATRAAPCAAWPHARTIAGAVRPTSLPHHGAAWETQQHAREKGVATTFTSDGMQKYGT